MVPAAHTLGVVVPARNGGAFIDRALASVFVQTRRPDEIVVVDDGSTDDTADRARAFGPEVTLVTTGGVGVARARNEGVATARSDFIAFLDADDYWDLGHLEAMSEAIRATGGRAAVYFSDMRLAPGRGGGTIWERCGVSIGSSLELRESDKGWLFARRQPILIQASVVRRSTYLELGGCDLDLIRRSDTHLLFKLGMAGGLCAVNGIAGEWTADNAASLTQTYTPEHSTYIDCTVALYEDLLRRGLARDRAQRRVLAGRAAAAHLTLAARDGLAGRRSAARHVATALALAPLGTIAEVAARVRRKLVPPGPAATGRGVTVR